MYPEAAGLFRCRGSRCTTCCCTVHDDTAELRVRLRFRRRLANPMVVSVGTTRFISSQSSLALGSEKFDRHWCHPTQTPLHLHLCPIPLRKCPPVAPLLCFCIFTGRNADVCTHKPALLAEQALSRNQQQQQVCATPGMHSDMSSERAYRRAGAKQVDSRGRRNGRGAAAALYGPDNKYRLNVREPARMTAELRAREREHGEKV